MQPTSPLRSVNTIKKFIKFCLKKKFKKCLTVSEINDQISEKKINSNLYQILKLEELKKEKFIYLKIVYYIL